MTPTTPTAGAHVSEKASRFTESVIREMTRLAVAHGAVNLAQGFPDFPAPAEIKEAAVAAIRAALNQYAITCGVRAHPRGRGPVRDHLGRASVSPANRRENRAFLSRLGGRSGATDHGHVR